MKIKKYFKRIVKLVGLDEMEILPGHLAFYLIFIIIPVIAFILLVTNNLNINLSNNIIDKNIPKAVVSLINGINLDFSKYNIFLFMFVSLLLARRGIKGIIISSNLLFKIKEKDNLKIQIKSIIITIILFILITFILLVPLFGDLIVNHLELYFKESGQMVINNIYHFIKYPISIIIMFLFIKIIYTISPSIKIKSKYMNKGAIFTTIMWLIFSRIYSVYLNNFTTYDMYYGSLSNVLILLIWVYLLSYIFVIGLALNADSYLMNNKVVKQ